MSLNTALGRRRSLLEETPEHARLIKFTSPILLDSEMKLLRLLQDPAFVTVTLPALFPVVDGPAGLARGLSELSAAAERRHMRKGPIYLLTLVSGATASAGWTDWRVLYTSDRDFVCDLLFACSLILVHLSRLSEDFIIYSTPALGFVELHDAYTTGSTLFVDGGRTLQ